MTLIHRPDLIGKTFEELYDGLNPEMRKGVDRIMWCFRKKLVGMTGVDQSAVARFELTVDDLRLLYDPLLPPELVKQLTPEEQIWTLASIDPVTWVRNFLKYEPRAYQILMLRDRSRIRAFRCGRRSGKTTCMLWEAIWFAYINPGITIIIVSPLEVQIKNMWEMIDKMLMHSGVKPLKSALQQFGITGKIRKPWEITFQNGSNIKAFTSGARSGGKADSVRGNEGHMIIIDEMDLMMPDDLDAITAMLQVTSDEFTGDKCMIVSSTPNGRRDMFYAFCGDTAMGGISQRWFPSFINPYFTPADEAEQRRLIRTEAGFIHEIVADWGQQTTGVFKPALLQYVANEPYSYWETRRTGTGPIILGVDWDKYGAGVNLVGVANVDGILTIVCREELERAQFEHTLGAGVNRVLQLDEKFNFSYVYCDKGYGERQWEELVEKMRWGETRVIGKNFSSSVLETDPVTMATTKEEFKPFMVDNAVNLYERKLVRFPEDDAEFIAQLTGYVQLRVSPTGRPVFGSMDEERIGDHALDAWMMALLGHTEMYGDLIIPFEQMSPRLANTNAALTPGENKEERQKKSQEALLNRRPLSTVSRKAAWNVFNRPGF
jgi:hypothetical protein